MTTPAPAKMAPAAGDPDLSLTAVTRVIGRHIPFYLKYAPTYHATLLRSLHEIWDRGHTSVLDVGGGTGIIAQAMKELFAIPRVVSVDVHDRFLGTLDIEARTYDGRRLPFEDGSFDCVVFSNVLHHVPVAARAGLMGECARVAGGGPVYIKDHLAASRLDHARLWLLDAIGNVPFGGMVEASYLGEADWQRLAAEAGYRIERRTSGPYRRGVYERLLPNRLEISMRLARA